jgi:tRNA (cmo5U34)-methyltransferase
MDRIKEHFEDEAEVFDATIRKLIPNYSEMVDILVSAIPFSKERDFSMIDLGCGTGTISKSVSGVFPNAKITCVDIAENMLEISKEKLGGGVTFIRADFNDFEFSDKYDLVVSSLALHHLENDADKLNFYKKIYSATNAGGTFINIDTVLGSDDFLHGFYKEKWKEFMSKNVSAEEIENKWLKNYYAEDRPATTVAHLDMLRECGFPCVDIIYKYFNFAVYTAKK